MNPVLVGSHNPRSDDPRYALWPDPPGCTGWRLWKMLAERTGATQQEYVDRFERANLQPGFEVGLSGFPRLSGVSCAGKTVVLLGEEVRRAYGLNKVLIHPQVVDGITYRCVPHPSGRCRFYNDPGARALVADLLEELYNEVKR